MSYPQQGQPQQYQQAQGGHVAVPQQHGGYAPAQQQHSAGGGYAMKRRNAVAVWLLPMVTFGIYFFVWYYKVHVELANYDRRIPNKAAGALLSLLFGVVTLFIWPLVVWVKLAAHIRQAQQAAGLQPSCSTGLGFLLLLLGFGSLYYQLELNKVVDRYQGATPNQQVPLYA